MTTGACGSHPSHHVCGAVVRVRDRAWDVSWCMNCGLIDRIIPCSRYVAGPPTTYRKVP